MSVVARVIDDDEGIREVLRRSGTVAVLGAHPERRRPAYYVPAYLAERGYRVLPVNPGFVGEELFGELFVARLPDVEEPVDLVDVFRRAEHVPDHVPEILRMEPLPRVVWLQLGIRSDEAAEKLVEAGIDVVQDHCALAEHRRLF